MRKNTDGKPKSSFLGIAKDSSIIMDKILSNKKVLKLMYYHDKNWDKEPDLNNEQIKSLFENKQLSNVPKVIVNEKRLTYLIINYDSFTTNAENPFYRDCIIELKIICHFDDWDLGNFELRPYRIAGELDAMLDNTHLTGIGELTFIGADQDIYDDEFGGITLRYLAIRGNEDKVNPLM